MESYEEQAWHLAEKTAIRSGANSMEEKGPINVEVSTE
jgi:hypothetical protein